MPNRLLMTGNTTKLQDNHFCTFGHLQLTNTHTFMCVNERIQSSFDYLKNGSWKQ